MRGIVRLRSRQLVGGAATGIALWCILFAFDLLPGFTADTWGLLFFALIGAALELTRFRVVLLVLVVLGALMIFVVSQTSIANAIASRWVREDRFPATSLPAVVVTSGKVNPNFTMSSEALDHLLTGIELVRSGKAATLVTTTVEERFPKALVSSRVDQTRIVTLLGVADRWTQTPPGQSTRDEAVNARASLLPKGIRRIALVASPMHTRRACATFEAVGFEVTCVPALSRIAATRDPAPWPADRLRVFGEWVYEVFGTMKYRSKGWLARPAPRP